jgi:5-(carboxyamino)imidazole ribonucleotide synthase
MSQRKHLKMTKTAPPKLVTQEVGILGGGQLARMLAECAVRMGLRPIIYSESADCPARDAASEVVTGRIEDETTLSRFLKRVSVVTFENEFVDCAKLRSAARAAGRNADEIFRPSLKAIETLQDKLSQKKLLARLKISTSPFVELATSKLLGIDGFREEILRAHDSLGGALVLKWSRLGYDGKGVRRVDPGKRGSQRALDKALDEAAEFCFAAAERGIPVYAERRVDFRRELAVIAVAPLRGKQVHYPLVVSEQENGICKLVTGPAIALGTSARRQTEAARAAERIARETGLTGSFGIEFFETRDGALLVNEIAPRVHNTGHYTQNAFSASQFENHWRAILGLALRDPLAEPRAREWRFAMLNVLGPEKIARSGDELPLPVPGPTSHLHWYGKKDIRSGRKLGHLNGVASGSRGLSALITELKRCEREWITGLKKTNSKTSQEIRKKSP